MDEKQFQQRISSKLSGLTISTEQALEALDSVLSIKYNEILLEGYQYTGEGFKADDLRYEVLALQKARKLLEKQISLEKAAKDAVTALEERSKQKKYNGEIER